MHGELQLPELIEEDELVDDEFLDDELVEDAPPHTLSGSSDDFGDDDFDSEMVEALGISPSAVLEAAPQTSYTTIPTELVNPPPQPPPPKLDVTQTFGSDDDEFGMDDEDEFAADLEHVASLYDTRSVEPSNHSYASVTEMQTAAATETVAPTTIISLSDDEEDEFGEDIDVDEFAAAEVAATQVPTNTVRNCIFIPVDKAVLNLEESTGY